MTDRKPPAGPKRISPRCSPPPSEGGGRARRAQRAIGDRVRGKVVSIGQEVTVLELDGGGEGTLETLELLDGAGELVAKEGDTLEARIVAMGERQGFVVLRRGAGPRRRRPRQPRRGGRHRAARRRA